MSEPLRQYVRYQGVDWFVQYELDESWTGTVSAYPTRVQIAEVWFDCIEIFTSWFIDELTAELNKPQEMYA